MKFEFRGAQACIGDLIETPNGRSVQIEVINTDNLSEAEYEQLLELTLSIADRILTQAPIQ